MSTKASPPDPPITIQPPCDQAYVLRVWSEEQDGMLRWRYLLRDSRSGAERSFSSLEQLLLFMGAFPGG